MTIVNCKDIKKYFPIERRYLKGTGGMVKAVDGVSLEIKKGEVYGLVGESGCGKTTLGKIVLGILKQDSGSVITSLRSMQAIFQDPFNSLDPKMRIYQILAEGLLIKGERKSVIMDRIEEVLGLVNLPKDALGKYPHQFSGGQRQRIAIGRAVLTRPEFIVCDEPVSSLDVTIQLAILNLLKEIRKRLNVTYLFISHDLRVVRYMCGRIAVMRDGKIVEEGPASEVYTNPKHAYTKSLLSAILDIP